MKRVRVAVEPAPYDVVIGKGALALTDLQRCLGKGAQGVVVSSRTVMGLHGGALKRAIEKTDFAIKHVVTLPDGEGAKTSRAWETTMRAMAKAGLDRSNFVIAFGGGSIGDAAGFAAATYMRGIRFVQIPTTLLSMVDSSVGGKTGINLDEGKNLVGAFHQPSLVIADLAFLKTLPSRERQSGVYEILKCALLRSKTLLSLLERTNGLRRATEGDMEAAITGAVTIKARVVENDERESGERVLLNLGHTLGHALEAATAYRVFTHGEGVGYGMEFAVDFSEELEFITAAEASRMRAAIEQLGPRTPILNRIVTSTQKATLSDKKRDGAQLKEILLKGVAQPVIHRMDAGAFALVAGAWLTSRANATRQRTKR